MDKKETTVERQGIRQRKRECIALSFLIFTLISVNVYFGVYSPAEHPGQSQTGNDLTSNHIKSTKQAIIDGSLMGTLTFVFFTFLGIYADSDYQRYQITNTSKNHTRSARQAVKDVVIHILKVIVGLVAVIVCIFLKNLYEGIIETTKRGQSIQSIDASLTMCILCSLKHILASANLAKGGDMIQENSDDGFPDLEFKVVGTEDIA